MQKLKKRLWPFITVLVLSAVIIFVSTQTYLPAEETKTDGKDKNTSNLSEFDQLKPYKIQVVDSKTRRGVPMVELKTTNGVLFYTDSNGYVYFCEPGLMNQDVYFLISSQGYKFPKEVMGVVGEKISVRPEISEQLGIHKVLSIDRVNIAERLYRVTGQGIYSDSVALGEEVPIDSPVINGRVMKQGSAHTVEYKGKVFWFWDETYGTFSKTPNTKVAGATSKLFEDGGLDPDVGVNLEYFTDKNGFVKEMIAGLKDASRVTIDSLITVKDDKSEEKLLAGYTAYSSADDVISRGILIFDDKESEFKVLKEFNLENEWQHPKGNAFLYDDNNIQYWMFANPYAVVRVKNDYNAIIDQSQYEAFTPVKANAKLNGVDTELEADDSGKGVWSWKNNAPPITQSLESELLKEGKLDTAYYQLKDNSNNVIELCSASIQWNEYRKKWILIGQQIKKGVPTGDIWYAETVAPDESPVGPWQNARLIVSHTDYGFNDPIQHPYFSQGESSFIYFEGHYTNENYQTKPTPQYNGNQIMYRLDLDDERLRLK